MYISSAARADTPSLIRIGSVELGPGRRVPRSDLKTLPLPAGRLPTATGSNSTVYYYNWSGYAATASNSFNQVASTFTQPSVSCPAAGAWAVFWVGFDGFTNGNVEQAGTAAQCSGGTSPQPSYYAWWEMYPTNYIQPMPITVHTGDTINAVVSYIATSNTYALTVADRSDQQTYTQTTTCAANLTCGRDSAEWIVERPTSGGAYTALADWGSMQLGADSASDTVSSGGSYVPQSVSAFTNTPIDMVSTSGAEVLATVSPLGTGGNIFTDTVNTASTTAGFTTNPSPATVGTPVTFDASASTCPAAPCTYAWSDGTAKLGTGPKLTYTFHYVGTKHVLLTLTDANGGKATVQHDLQVNALATAARFTTSPPSPVRIGTQVTFDASSSTCAAAPCTYAWKDGTAKLGTGPKLTYTFHYAGTKHVLLTLTDARGAKSAVEHDLTVS